MCIYDLPGAEKGKGTREEGDMEQRAIDYLYQLHEIHLGTILLVSSIVHWGQAFLICNSFHVSVIQISHTKWTQNGRQWGKKKKKNVLEYVYRKYMKKAVSVDFCN